MTAFLTIDRCGSCQKQYPWEWVAPLTVASKCLPGTGVWRSSLIDGLCTTCIDTLEARRRRENYQNDLRERFIRIVGGVKPYRSFTFERYQINAGNRTAVALAASFDPSRDNLYIWGSWGVGKTHLAVAILRRCFAKGITGDLVTPARLIRRLRMKSPEDEQTILDYHIRSRVLVLDDLGIAGETAYGRQILQEVLDGRLYADRGGLIVTSVCSPRELAARLKDGAVSSRLAGMCRVIEIRGPDRRQNSGKSDV